MSARPSPRLPPFAGFGSTGSSSSATGHSAKAVKRVPRLRQGYSLGRLFPEQLTAALVLEGLAQTGGLLAFDAIHFRKAPIMAKITKAEFHGETEPGSVLEYAAELERLDDDGAAVRITSRCGERLHAQAQILFAFVGDEGGSSMRRSGDLLHDDVRHRRLRPPASAASSFHTRAAAGYRSMKRRPAPRSHNDAIPKPRPVALSTAGQASRGTPQ